MASILTSPSKAARYMRPQHKRPANVACGSNADTSRRRGHVRLLSQKRTSRSCVRCPLSARNGLIQRSKTVLLYSGSGLFSIFRTAIIAGPLLSTGRFRRGFIMRCLFVATRTCPKLRRCASVGTKDERRRHKVGQPMHRRQQRRAWRDPGNRPQILHVHESRRWTTTKRGPSLNGRRPEKNERLVQGSWLEVEPK